MLLTCIFKSKGLKLSCGIVKAQEIEKVNDKEGGKVRKTYGCMGFSVSFLISNHITICYQTGCKNMSKNYPEFPLYIKELHNPKLCAIAREDKSCHRELSKNIKMKMVSNFVL